MMAYTEYKDIYSWPCGCLWIGIRAANPLNADYGTKRSQPCKDHFDCIADEDVLRLNVYEFAGDCGLDLDDAEFIREEIEY